MPRKYLIVLFFVAFIGAGHALAQAPETECPPECVTDSLEIVTYYPSPYGYYEELRGDKIIVGDSNNSYINETDLPPTGTITFEPKSADPNSSDGRLYEGSLYYQKGTGGIKGKFRFYDGIDWEDVGGGSAIALPLYTASTKPVCDTLGKMIFLTDIDRPYVCSSGGWTRVGEYFYQSEWISPGTYTFTVPSNTYDIVVEAWGGGGGGGGGGSCEGGAGAGGSGGNSSVGSLLIAYGGAGGGGGSQWSSVAGSGGIGGTSNGNTRIAGYNGTAGNGSGGGTGGAGAYSSGGLSKGGNGGAEGYHASGDGGGGGGGGYGKGIFNVTPGATLSVNVGGAGGGGGGGAGSGGCSLCCGGPSGSNGSAGKVVIRY